MINPYLDAIYCDDIRHETNGKLTLIGVYSGSMVASELPITLPKLCIVAKVVSPLKDEFDVLKVEIRVDDDTIQEFTIKKEDIKKAKSTAPIDDSATLQVHNIMLSINSLTLDKACKISTRAFIDDLELESPQLKVTEEEHQTSH